MISTSSTDLTFPLFHMQAAYFVGEMAGLPLSTTARYYREVEFEAFDIALVQQAWTQLIERHAALRTVLLDSGFQQILNHVPTYQIVYYDLNECSPEQRAAMHASIRERMLNEALPLSYWPQFSIQASGDNEKLRLHIRSNLWTIDASSMQIMLAELLQLCNFPEQPLPPLRGTFREYVESVAANQNSPSVERSRKYWYQRADRLPLGPLLPLKCAVEDIAEPVFAHLGSIISASNWSAFVATAQAQRITPSIAVLTAYALTLARWSKKRHFTITLLLSKRPFAGEDMEGVVGNFGTTILLEVNALPSQSFLDLAKTINKQFWSDVRNLDISGIDVVREVNRVRDTPMGMGSPVTFTSLMYGEEAKTDQQKALKKISHLYSHLDVPQVFLDHQIVEEPQGHLTVSWDFVPELFHAGVVENMFDTFINLINTLASHPQYWQEEVKLDLPGEQIVLLENYNQTSAIYPDTLLDTLIIKQVEEHPEQTAIIHGDQHISYYQLGLQARQLSQALNQFDYSPGYLIGLALPKGWQQIVAVVGIAQTAAAYVPIDPDLPYLRRAQLLEQSGITLLVTTSALAEQLQWPESTNLICIDQIAASLKEDLRHRGLRTSSDTAYVIYTSGSTGMPKGVVIDHAGAVNTIFDINHRLDINAGDKVLALSSISFDLSVYDVFGVLAAGGTIIIPGVDQQQDPGSWYHLIESHGVTLWNSVPALFQLMVDYALQIDGNLSSLRNVMLSGDWIPLNLPEKGRSIAPQARIFSLGGATEASIWSVIYEIGFLDDNWRTIPYGRPLANQSLHVLDETLQPCPIWQSGELYIGGKGLAKGYLHDETRTNERFIRHPLSGQRLYRTGDMTRMRPDGYMEFLGREDHQIKIRGFRIELGEIESVILKHCPVLAAVTKVTGSSDANKRLMSFVVLKQGYILVPNDISEVLKQYLPKYMVPDMIHIVDAMPLSPNGKIDHRQLEEICTVSMASTDAAKQQQFGQGSENAVLTEAVSQIWCELLGQTNIAPNASFFSLGGTSFQALQLVAKIRKRFNINMRLSEIYSRISVREMVEQLSQKSKNFDQSEQQLLSLSLNTDTSGACVFCIHPVGGSAHCYIPLAKYIAPELAVFGIQSTAHITQAMNLFTIEKLAAHYTELILQTAPTGPYFLVGWSMGGALAVEIGRILKSREKHIAFVGLIDPYCSVRQSTENSGPLDMLFSFCDDLAGLVGKDFILPPNYSTDYRSLEKKEVFVELIREMTTQGILPENPPIEELHQVFQIFERNSEALANYVPLPVDLELTVLYADSDANFEHKHLHHWHPIASAVDAQHITADHFTIMQEPAIEKMATALNKCLA